MRRIAILVISFLLACMGAVYAAAPPPIPRAPAPSSTLTVLDLRSRPRNEWPLAASIQGIVNRKQPRIYLIGVDSDRFWLDVLKQKRRVKEERTCADIRQLAGMFRDEVGGLVVVDPALTVTVNVATIIASMKGLAVATPDLVQSVGLPVKMDLRGKWKTEVEAYKWAYDSFWKSMSHRALSWTDPGENYHLERDYLIQQKIWPVWICGKIDGARGGADIRTQKLWTEKLMAETPGNIPIYGFPYDGEDIGIGEMGGTELASIYGKYNVCTSLNANLSVHSGYPPAVVKMRRTPAPRFDPSKCYIAFILSDGDNFVTFASTHLALWKQRPAKRPPISWSIGSAAVYVIPEIVRWYYETAVPGDTFITDVSGVGYMYPPVYGERLGDPGLLRRYARITTETSKMLDIQTLALHDFLGTLPQHYEVFASEWPGIKGIFADYTMRFGMTPEKANYRLASGTPVMHALVKFEISPDREKRIASAVDDIRKAAAKRPAFVNAFMVNWFTDPDECAEIMHRLGDGYVAVSPDALASYAATRLRTRPRDLNLALTAKVSSPDGKGPDLAITETSNDHSACDGSESSYWDEVDNSGPYVLQLDFERIVKPRRMELLGFKQENFAPKSFEVLLDGKVVKTATDLRYKDNLAKLTLPGKPCRRLALRITAWYGGSPAVRELRVYE